MGIDFDGLGIEVDDKITCLDDRLGVALGAADDGANASHRCAGSAPAVVSLGPMTSINAPTAR